jgi:hypothetical protein
MRAAKYGRPKPTRAPNTASGLLASNEKNQTPGTPSRWTYVRTFNSWDALKRGTAGRSTGRNPHMVKGVTPTHATPSKVSMTRGSGIRGRNACAGTGQCMKSSFPQVWYMICRPGGRERTDRRSSSLIGSLSMNPNPLQRRKRTSRRTRLGQCTQKTRSEGYRSGTAPGASPFIRSDSR